MQQKLITSSYLLTTEVMEIFSNRSPTRYIQGTFRVFILSAFIFSCFNNSLQTDFRISLPLSPYLFRTLQNSSNRFLPPFLLTTVMITVSSLNQGQLSSAFYSVCGTYNIFGSSIDVIGAKDSFLKVNTQQKPVP